MKFDAVPVEKVLRSVPTCIQLHVLSTISLTNLISNVQSKRTFETDVLQTQNLLLSMIIRKYIIIKELGGYVKVNKIINNAK